MSQEQLPEFIRFLLNPEAYPHAAPEVKLVQTHISYVLLAGDYVYKFKKPVDFGFLDFTTLGKRSYYCERELILNRRLCPDVYLKVITVNRGTAGLALEGDGETVEYGVKMLRLPEERMMGRLIAAGELTRQSIDAIVAVLEPFYDQAGRGPAIDRYATPAAVGANVLENLHQVAPFVGCEALPEGVYTEIDDYVRTFLENHDLFTGRIGSGRIRDCHGDLHSGNICLADRVYVFDCIEFNERFRYGDVANDIAFLAMDLDYNGLEDLGAYFIDRFVTDTGDEELRRVLCFYKCYRAAVRGKIGLLTGHEEEVVPANRQLALDRAKKYFALAREYASGGGAPGTCVS